MEITPEIQALLDTQASELNAKFETDTAGLKKSQQDLLAEKSARQEALAASEAEAEAARLEKARATKDIDTLTESYEARLKEVQDENASLLTGIKQGKVKDIAASFVNTNIVDDEFSRQAMTAEYAKRIDIREGKPVVLDVLGNLTSLSVEDLNKEILSSSIYAGHIKSTNANGGGANGSRAKDAGRAGAKPNLNGSTSEKASALSGRIDGFDQLPVN